MDPIVKFDCYRNSAVPNVAVFQLLKSRLSLGHLVMWCGNGGSAADAQHFSTELVVRYKRNRRALKSICLSSDPCLITAIANDFGFSHIFSRQIEALASENDILIALSTSAKSENIIEALTQCKQLGVTSVLVTGVGKKCIVNADYTVFVPGSDTASIQENMKIWAHELCNFLEIEVG